MKPKLLLRLFANTLVEFPNSEKNEAALFMGSKTNNAGELQFQLVRLQCLGRRRGAMTIMSRTSPQKLLSQRRIARTKTGISLSKIFGS
jgi:hypothetical protein